MSRTFALRRQRTSTALVATIAAMVAIDLVALALLAWTTSFGVALIAGFNLLLVVLAVVFERDRRSLSRADTVPCEVELDGGTLRIDRRRLRRASIHGGRIEPADGGFAIALDLHRLGRTVSLFAECEDEARALLAALELDVPQTTMTFRARVSSGARRNRPALVEVGADGLHLRWSGRARFVAIRGVGHADPAPGRGRRIGVESEGRPTVELLPERDGDAMATRLRHAQEDAASLEPPVELELPDRGVQGPVEWLAALREASELGSHRRVPLERQRLWRTVESPVAGAPARAKALGALSPGFDRDERRNLARIARATANPELRTALEAAAAAADDATLATALAAAADATTDS